VHGGAELGGANCLNVARLQLIRRSRHAQTWLKRYRTGHTSKSCSCREAELDLSHGSLLQRLPAAGSARAGRVSPRPPSGRRGPGRSPPVARAARAAPPQPPRRILMGERPAQDLRKMVVYVEPVGSDSCAEVRLESRSHKRVLGAREPDIDDASSLADRQRDAGAPAKSLRTGDVSRHASSSSRSPGCPGRRKRRWCRAAEAPQVDQKNDRKLESLAAWIVKERDGFSARRLLRGLTDGELGVDDLSRWRTKFPIPARARSRSNRPAS